MRVLHFSDLHIGVENYGRTDPNTGLSTRLGDFLAALDELVEFALSNQVDLVVLAGDAYKGRDPSQTHQREFAIRLRRLSAAGIPTFLLAGNHDLPGNGKPGQRRRDIRHAGCSQRLCRLAFGQPHHQYARWTGANCSRALAHPGSHAGP